MTIFSVTLSLPLFLTAGLQSSATSEAKILKGPNVLVSRESPYPNVELMVAANPRDPNNLIGTAIVSTPVRDHNVIFVSFDAGNSWRTVDLPEVPEDGTGNAQVAFDNEGLAYFSVLGQSRNKSGDKQFQITLFRSRDGGRTWAPAGSYGAGNNPDHDQMTVDNSSSIYT